jgi:lipopolysaccharide exporter
LAVKVVNTLEDSVVAAAAARQQEASANIVDRSGHGLGQRIASGAAWMILMQLTMRLIGLGSTLILVRLLTPDDFGIVAMAGVTAGLLDTLSGFAFEMALMQRSALGREHFDTVWTLNVLRGAVISMITAASAPLMAAMMREPRIEPVMYVLALVPLLQGFDNIALVNWQRDLHFDKIFRLRTYGKVLGMCLVIPVVFVVTSYWALVIGQVGGSVITVSLGYYLCPYRPRLTMSAWQTLFHFSKWLSVGNVLTVIESYSIVFLISRLFGSATLGLYYVSMEIGHLPASEVAAPIRRPLYAGYAKVDHDLPALGRQFVDGFGIVLMLVVPLSVGLAITADSTAQLFLGPKWVGAAPLITISALWAMFANIGYLSHNLYIIRQAQAQFAKMLATMQIIRISLLIPIGLEYGLIGALLAILATAILNCFVWLTGALRLLQMRWYDALRVSWRTIVATFGMALTVLYLSWLWPQPGALPFLVWRLGVLCVVGAVVHIGLQLSFWLALGQATGPERYAVEWLRSILILRPSLPAASVSLSPIVSRPEQNANNSDR